MRHYSTRYKYKLDVHELFYSRKFSVKQRDEMWEWCTNTFGKEKNWGYYMWVWRFRYKKDFTAFLLRWS